MTVKKNIEPIFGKVNEGDQIEKNIAQISGKVNEGDKIKNFWSILKKVYEGDKKKRNKDKAGKCFLSPEMNLFFSECFFLSSEINFFSRKSAKNPMRALSREKTHVVFLVMRGLNLMRALI